jgi:hypothetical protein
MRHSLSSTFPFVILFNLVCVLRRLRQDRRDVHLEGGRREEHGPSHLLLHLWPLAHGHQELCASHAVAGKQDLVDAGRGSNVVYDGGEVVPAGRVPIVGPVFLEVDLRVEDLVAEGEPGTGVNNFCLTINY